jgi:death-on-curing protein
MRILLIENDLDISASQDEKFEFVISIASGQTRLEKIVEWLNNHVVKYSP